MISYPIGSQPFIKPHIDGPVLVTRCGQMRWLSLFERLQWHLGWTDAHKLESKHFRYRRQDQ